MNTTNQLSTATNIAGPNVANDPNNSPNKFFNNLYSQNLSTGPANDAMVAFFEEHISSKTAANNLAAAVLYTALAQNLNPMQVLLDFRNIPKGQLNIYLAAFLNVNRIPTSILGFKQPQTVNTFVARTVLI
jgi:hypothetical protein